MLALRARSIPSFPVTMTTANPRQANQHSANLRPSLTIYVQQSLAVDLLVVLEKEQAVEQEEEEEEEQRLHLRRLDLDSHVRILLLKAAGIVGKKDAHAGNAPTSRSTSPNTTTRLITHLHLQSNDLDNTPWRCEAPRPQNRGTALHEGHAAHATLSLIFCEARRPPPKPLTNLSPRISEQQTHSLTPRAPNVLSQASRIALIERQVRAKVIKLRSRPRRPMRGIGPNNQTKLFPSERVILRPLLDCLILVQSDAVPPLPIGKPQLTPLDLRLI